MQVLYNSAILLLGIYPREIKTNVHAKHLCTKVIETLLVIGKNWKQPRHSSVGKWLSCDRSISWDTT